MLTLNDRKNQLPRREKSNQILIFKSSLIGSVDRACSSNVRGLRNGIPGQWSGPAERLSRGYNETFCFDFVEVDGIDLFGPLPTENKTNQWLGVTVRSQGPGGKVLVGFRERVSNTMLNDFAR